MRVDDWAPPGATSHVIDAEPFAEAYGLSAGGATLVRPDGVVAWRARGPADRDELARALATALAHRSLTSRTRHPRGGRPGTSTGAMTAGSREGASINPDPTEATMSTIDTRTENTVQVPQTGTIDFKLEVTILPVSDAEQAKQFYASLGWREDADFVLSEDLRVLQFTPPGSQASIIFGDGVTAAVPGSAGSLLLAVDDLDAARADLIERGVDVSEVFHGVAFTAGGKGRVPGPDPERNTYGSYASFTDPDGNEWLLQEVTSRLPGRVDETDLDSLAGQLLETALHHGRFEQVAPEHNWWDWYAAYLDARQHGSTPEQADAAADLHMKEAFNVVPR